MSELPAIISIHGFEPSASGDEPHFYMVGRDTWIPGGGTATVTRIDPHEEFYGDHGLAWLDVFAGETLVCSMQRRAVAVIYHG